MPTKMVPEPSESGKVTVSSILLAIDRRLHWNI
jgi:hypothetical protein